MKTIPAESTGLAFSWRAAVESDDWQGDGPRASRVGDPTAGIIPVRCVAEFLDRNHYLGPTDRGVAWRDEFGVMVWASPTSRRLPHDRWLELVRWCLVGTKNGGSQQFARWRRWITKARPDLTTFVSYSDPSQGHTGALYKACNWQWAPTWHRLFPPPTGNGDWGSGPQAVKDRWIYILRDDPGRAEILRIKDGRRRD